MNGEPSEKSIGLVIPYFGHWPAWIPLFIESCRWNSSVNWLLIGDHELPGPLPENVQGKEIAFPDYVRRVEATLGVHLNWTDRYRLTDVKPMLGLIHESELRDYDYYGWSDLDVIYGDIRAFYDPSILKHLLISSHEDRISGHFTLVENTEEGRRLFERVRGWRTYLTADQHQAFDEFAFSKLFLGPHPGHRRLTWLSRNCRPLWWRSYFREQYSTPFNSRPWRDGSWDHPTEWYWRDGKVTNSRDGGREFLYLHFMNFRSGRYRGPRFGPTAPWDELAQVNRVKPGDYRRGFKISLAGFEALT